MTVGTTSCQVSVGFQPTRVGTYTTNFQMLFQNPQTGAPLTVQNLTLIGRGV
jgi:hypothetical protein